MTPPQEMTVTDWESRLNNWSRPSSADEAARIANAERMIRDAIRESAALKTRGINVFAQGSYRNNTNVRHNSDIDIVVCCTDTVFFDFQFAPGLGPANVGLVTPAEYSFATFRNDVGRALITKFGASGVTRGSKAYDVHENTYRISADVVATFENHRYNPDGTYETGVAFIPDRGARIENWPDQQYLNGVTKNAATGGRYKLMVRALKGLRNEMHERGTASAAPIPSFLIECMVWNVPNEGFGHATYLDDMRWVLAHTFNSTMTDDACREWGEVSELKYLFRPSRPWTRLQAHQFLADAWDYLELG